MAAPVASAPDAGGPPHVVAQMWHGLHIAPDQFGLRAESERALADRLYPLLASTGSPK